MNTQTTPSHGFAFPQDARDQIDQRLRESLGQQQPIRSVRPDKQPPLVRPSAVEDEPTPMLSVTPSPTTSVASPDAVSIDLPFRFHYYQFKDLYVKPMRTPQLAKMSKGHETSSLQTQAEAVSSLLFSPTGHEHLALSLTMADYQAVLYWLRLNSFSKPQMRVNSKCNNPAHIAQVKAGTKTLESLNIQTVVTESSLKTNYLDKVPDPEVYCLHIDGVTVNFRPETLRDTIQFLDHPEWADEEFQYKSRIAAVLGLDEATGRVWTWDQRIQFVDTLTPDQSLLALEFADLIDGVGVVESATAKCQGCGSTEIITITCDPLSFLSPKF